jgi:hypothetical protein
MNPIVLQNANVFDANEFDTLHANLTLMQADIRQQYEYTLDRSHRGHPTIVEMISTGSKGCPHIRIDPDFLRWAYKHHSVSGISQFLHVGCRTVRKALIEYGIADPQENPFSAASQIEVTGELHNHLIRDDDFLDPIVPLPPNFPGDIMHTDTNDPQVMSFTGPLSALTDTDLDDLIKQLRCHFHRAGIRMLNGMLRCLGHHVPQDFIRDSLMRIDPVQRVFQQIQIRRHEYSVPGPNALWHHDGQHGKRTSAFCNWIDFLLL